jgi:hypothetical protein
MESEIDQMTLNHLRSFAAKYLRDNNPLELTDENLNKAFEGCALSPRKEFYDTIRDMIKEIKSTIDQMKG